MRESGMIEIHDLGITMSLLLMLRALGLHNTEAKNNKTRPTNMSMDRLSDLPENILHRILSFLPPEDAMVTTRLSRAWRNVWIGLPCLNMGKSLFDGRLDRRFTTALPTWRHGPVSEELKHQYVIFMEQTLRKRLQSNIAYVEKVSLYLPSLKILHSQASAILDHCMKLAFLKLHVDELEFEIDITYDGYVERKSPYKFPIHKVPVRAAPLPLKRLSLTGVALDPKMIHFLAKHCPLIKKLQFCGCSPLQVFEVIDFPQLSEFVLLYDKSSELCIHAPNLNFLKYQGNEGGQCEIDVSTCRSLKRIDISTAKFCLKRHSAILSVVEDLALSDCGIGTIIGISSNSLKSLSLNDVDEVNIDAPNLKYLTIDGIMKSSSKLMLSHSSLEMITIQACPSEYIQNIRNTCLPASISPCKILKIILLSGNVADSKALINMPEKVLKANSPLYDFKHLILHFSHPTTAYRWCHDLGPSITEFLRSFLWVSKRLLSISISAKEAALRTFKFKYYDTNHDVVRIKKCRRCKSLPEQCWKHQLQEVTIEKHIRADASDEGDETMEAFDTRVQDFFEMAREGNKIIVSNLNSVC